MKTEDYTLFRTNIKQVRSFMLLSAKDLSDKAGLRQQKRVSDIEDGRGSPDLGEVIQLCKALNQPIDNMLFKVPKIIFV